jgi:hypothetical protein
MDADRHKVARLAAELQRLLAVIAVFGIVGPPVGGLVTWAIMGARTMRSPLPFITGSYSEGIVLALAAGGLVAAAWGLGRTSWLVPVAVAVSVDLVMLAIAADLSRPDLAAGLLRVAGVFFPPILVACLTCWWLTRRLLRSA